MADFAPEVLLTGDEILGKLKQFKTLFIDNEKLFNEFYDLNEKKEREDIVKGNNCVLDIEEESKVAICLETSQGAKRILKKFEKLDGRPKWNDPAQEEADRKEYEELLREIQKEDFDAYFNQED